MPRFYVGLMSGTSLDGVDAALVDLDTPSGRLVASHFLPYPDDVRAEALALCAPGANEIERAGDLGNRIADLYADAVHRLLHGAGGVAVEAIGATARPSGIVPNAASPCRCSTPRGSPNAPDCAWSPTCAAATSPPADRARRWCRRTTPPASRAPTAIAWW